MLCPASTLPSLTLPTVLSMTSFSSLLHPTLFYAGFSTGVDSSFGAAPVLLLHLFDPLSATALMVLLLPGVTTTF